MHAEFLRQLFDASGQCKLSVIFVYFIIKLFATIFSSYRDPKIVSTRSNSFDFLVKQEESSRLNLKDNVWLKVTKM